MSEEKTIRRRDCVKLANKVIDKCELPLPRIASIDGIRSNLFTTLLQVLYHRLPDGIIEDPQSTEDEVSNVQTLINHLALDLIHIDLSHISGADVIAGDPRAIYNLLEIFCGLHKYLSSTSIGKWNLEETFTETESELGSRPSSEEDVAPAADDDADEAEEGDDDEPGDRAGGDGPEDDIDRPPPLIEPLTTTSGSRVGSRTSQPTGSASAAPGSGSGSVGRTKSAGSAARGGSSTSAGRVPSGTHSLGKTTSNVSAGRRPSGDSAARVRSTGSAAARVGSTGSAAAHVGSTSSAAARVGSTGSAVAPVGSSGSAAARVGSTGSAAARVGSTGSAVAPVGSTGSAVAPVGSSGSAAAHVGSSSSAGAGSIPRAASGTGSVTKAPSGGSLAKSGSRTSAAKTPSRGSLAGAGSGGAVRQRSATASQGGGASASGSGARVSRSSSGPVPRSSQSGDPDGEAPMLHGSQWGPIATASATSAGGGGSRAEVRRSSSLRAASSGASQRQELHEEPSVQHGSEWGPLSTTSIASAGGGGGSGVEVRRSGGSGVEVRRSGSVRPASSRPSQRRSGVAAAAQDRDEDLTDDLAASPPRAPSGAGGDEFAAVGRASATRPSVGGVGSRSGIELSGSIDHHHYHHYEDEEEGEFEEEEEEYYWEEDEEEEEEEEEADIWGPDRSASSKVVPPIATTQEKITALEPEDDEEEEEEERGYDYEEEEEEEEYETDVEETDPFGAAAPRTPEAGDAGDAAFDSDHMTTADDDVNSPPETEPTEYEDEDEEEEEGDEDISRALEEEMEERRRSLFGSGTTNVEASVVTSESGAAPHGAASPSQTARESDSRFRRLEAEAGTEEGVESSASTMEGRGDTRSSTRAAVSKGASMFRAGSRGGARRRCSSSSQSDPGMAAYRASGTRSRGSRNIETIAEITETARQRDMTETTREEDADGCAKEVVTREVRRKVCSSAPHPGLGYTKQSSRRSVCSDGVTDWLESQADDTYLRVEGQEADVFEYLRREFPYVHVSAETKRRLLCQYRKQMKYIMSLVEPVESRKIKIRRRDVLKRQALLTDIMRQQKNHDQKFQELADQKRREIRVRNMPRDSKISCLRAQRYVSSFQQQFASRSAYNKSKEELLLRAVFEEMLEIQRCRLRMVRGLEKQAIQEFYDADGYTADLNRMHQYYEANFRELAQLLARERADLQLSRQQQCRLADRIRREFRDYMEADVRSLNDKIVNSWQPQFRELDADRVRNDLYQAHWKFCVT